MTTTDPHAPQTEAILTLKGVRKVYGETVAVDDINLDLRKGEFLTFLGPSGSGKTTTLSMVAGLQAPSAGTILLDGRPLGPLPPYQRNIGMVFQNYALFPHMTVAGNVAFPLEMRKLARDEIRRKVSEALALVGLPAFGSRYPAQLSGGQQQRVALARAMVFRPPLLLMDEPLGALDKKLREQMQIEIMRLHRDLRMSILYVTHDQEEALVMSDRIAVFNKGLIEQIGSAQELYERPVTQFVAGFLGDSNFFTGKVADAGQDTCVVEGPDGRFEARNTAALKIGSPAVDGVRPERLSNHSEDHPGANGVEAKVTEIIYLGQSRKYVMKTARGTDVFMLEQAGLADRHSVALGDTLRLTWAPAESNALAPGS